MKKIVIKILIISLCLITLLVNLSLASQTKWSAYPEWGIMVKATYFSTSMVILFSAIQIVLHILKNKNKIKNKIYNINFFLTIISICSMIISMSLVALDIHENVFVFYGISMIIGVIIDILITKKIPYNTRFKVLVIVDVILAVMFFWYSLNWTYPFEGYDPGDGLRPCEVLVLD